MAERSSIEWCDSTWNPWIGCTKVSPACDHCYAERDFDLRRHVVQWGAGQARKRTSTANWKNPERWNKQAFCECPACGWRGEAREAMRGCDCPSCMQPGVLVSARRRVFCASLADVFDNEVPVEWRRDLFSLIERTPNLDWLLLTKRIGSAERMMREACGFIEPNPGCFTPRPNVWLGATICNQTEADRDIPKLLATPAAVRFVSIEPMLGPIDLWNMTTADGAKYNALSEWMIPGTDPLERRIDWVICGGESGPSPRPMHPEWARSLRDQCAAAGVPFLFKQWGEWGPSSVDDVPSRFSDPALSQFRVISTCGFVCEVNFGSALLHRPHTYPKCFPNAEHSDAICEPCFVRRIGKKAAGRLLDGIEHNGFPRAAT